MVRPSSRREAAHDAVENRGVSIRVACAAFMISETCYRYDPKNQPENETIAMWLISLTECHKRWGFCLCYYYLRNERGFGWNHKRIYRIYKELELNLRIKPHKRIRRDKPEALAVPLQKNEVWSMDFMSDSLDNGRKFRTFNVIDDYNREGLCVDVDFSLPSARVIRSLEQVIEWRGKPRAIRCDNGPEYVSAELEKWAEKEKIILLHTQPGHPTQNAYIERFNRTARHEWLEMHSFHTIEEAQALATEWLWSYNNVRPHTSIGGIPPVKMLANTQNSTLRLP